MLNTNTYNSISVFINNSFDVNITKNIIYNNQTNISTNYMSQDIQTYKDLITDISNTNLNSDTNTFSSNIKADINIDNSYNIESNINSMNNTRINFITDTLIAKNNYRKKYML